MGTSGLAEPERPYRSATGPVHHGSHIRLVDSHATTRWIRQLDAVVVPASRPATYLRSASLLARDLGCPLVVLCSKLAQPSEAIRVANEIGTTPIIAVDVQHGWSVLPAFETTRLLDGTAFAPGSDLSIKRNLGLVLARAGGWERILFLDDDMQIPQVTHVKVAAGLLDRYRAVGLYNTGFPDHSVVCRINRQIGREQEQFIGAGALVVHPGGSRSFFPDIYCEDWFYFLSEDEPPRLGVAGEVAQRMYDPFEDPDRAQREEFGDSLAEGLYWLLDDEVVEQSVLDRADVSFWADSLARRRAFIREMASLIERVDCWDRRAIALKHALDVNLKITPDLCVRYLEAWRADLEVWRGFVGQIAAAADGAIESALDRIGLRDVAYLS